MSKVCATKKDFLYRQTRNWVIGQLRTGKLKPGSKLPGERALAEILKISRGTTRVALQELEKEGIVERVPSKGAFIKAETQNRSLKLALIFSEDEISHNFIKRPDWTSAWQKRQGLLKSCTENNASLAFFHCKSLNVAPELLDSYIEELYELLVNEFDGAVFTCDKLKELKKTLLERNFPFISISSDGLEGEKRITYNFEHFHQQAANFLLARKCKNIVILSDKLKNKSCKKQLDSFRDHLDEHSSEKFIVNTWQMNTEVHISLKDNIEKYEKLPDAFLCTDEKQTFALLSLAEKMNWNIPEDFIVIEFYSNNSVSHHINKKVAYLKIPYFEMGMAAGKYLTQNITTGTALPEKTIIEGKFISQF